MKKILILLAIAGLVNYSADAQTTRINACGVNKGKVCRLSPNKRNASCYKTKFAENFKVCKGGDGYFICCESPGKFNSTFQEMPVVRTRRPYQPEYASNKRNDAEVDMSIPQSQSYV